MKKAFAASFLLLSGILLGVVGTLCYPKQQPLHPSPQQQVLLGGVEVDDRVSQIHKTLSNSERCLLRKGSTYNYKTEETKIFWELQLVRKDLTTEIKIGCTKDVVGDLAELCKQTETAHAMARPSGLSEYEIKEKE